MIRHLNIMFAATLLLCAALTPASWAAADKAGKSVPKAAQHKVSGGAKEGAREASSKRPNIKAKAIDRGPSGLAIPRFESLSSDKVNLRSGPGVRYPIAWVFTRKGLPVKVLAEFEYWRKVRDSEGAEGWIHKSLIRGRRMAVVSGGVRNLFSQPDRASPVMARVEAGVLGRLLACRGAWCRLETAGRKGWIRREFVFGALDTEIFE